METVKQEKALNRNDLESKVKSMYRDVAMNPFAGYHFHMGRGLAEKLGYEVADLNLIPPGSLDSFAGVGYFIDIAAIRKGESVLDLGSGSGMDSFVAASKAGEEGMVTGIDMTDQQLAKANQLAEGGGFRNVRFVKGYIEDLPFDDNEFDIVISNGVINLSATKEKVFAEIARVLKPGGRMVIADIVTEREMPESITCDSTLWASCIGGAGQEDAYQASIENAGMEVEYVRNNSAYEFISSSARKASGKYGVKSVSFLARKNSKQ